MRQLERTQCGECAQAEAGVPQPPLRRRIVLREGKDERHETGDSADDQDEQLEIHRALSGMAFSTAASRGEFYAMGAYARRVRVAASRRIGPSIVAVSSSPTA